MTMSPDGDSTATQPGRSDSFPATAASSFAGRLPSGMSGPARNRGPFALDYRRKRLLASALALAALAWFGWRMPNHYSGETPRFDQTVFLAMAHHWNGGKVLYRDFWDHKPPGIFFINRLFVALDPHMGVNAARWFEKLAAAGMGIVCFGAARSLGCGRLASWMGGLVFLWCQYRPDVIEGGNTTEEWGAAALWVGMMACVSVRRARRPWRFGLTAGACMAGACLLKEPFFLCGLPWALGSVWALPRRRRRRCGLRFLGGTAAGCGLALLPWAAYFTAYGLWFEASNLVAYNMAYSAYIPAEAAERAAGLYAEGGALERLASVGTWATGLWCGGAGAAALAWLGWGAVLSPWRASGRRWRHRRWWLPAGVAGAWAAAGLGGRYFGHYALMMGPSLALLAAAGADALVRWTAEGVRQLRLPGLEGGSSRSVWIARLSTAAAALALALWGGGGGRANPAMSPEPARADWRVRLTAPHVAYETPSPIEQYGLDAGTIRREGMWAMPFRGEPLNALDYLRLGVYSPTPILVGLGFHDTGLRTGREHLRRWLEPIRAKSPAVLVAPPFLEEFSDVFFEPETASFFEKYTGFMGRCEWILIRDDLLPPSGRAPALRADSGDAPKASNP